METEAKVTHIAIPVIIYQFFLDSIKSEKGLTAEALAKVILSAKTIIIQEESTQE